MCKVVSEFGFLQRLQNLMDRSEEAEEEKMEVEQDELVNNRDQLVSNSLTPSLIHSLTHWHLSLYPPQLWFDAAVQLLDDLCQNENSPPFLKPVDTETCPVSK